MIARVPACQILREAKLELVERLFAHFHDGLQHEAVHFDGPQFLQQVHPKATALFL